MIIGSPGSGKITFTRKLREKSGIPLFHLDMMKHKPDRTEISLEDFDVKLKEIFNLPWVETEDDIENGFSQWIEEFSRKNYRRFMHF